MDCSDLGPEKIPARIAPRDLRCRVNARVSIPLIPTMKLSSSSDASERSERKFETTLVGSLTT